MLATRGVGPRRGHWHWQSESPHELRLQLEVQVFEHAERQVDILPIEHSILRAFVWQLRGDLGTLVVSRPVDSKTGPQVSQADSQLPYNMKFCPDFNNHYDKLARESPSQAASGTGRVGTMPPAPLRASLHGAHLSATVQLPLAGMQDPPGS